MICATEIPKLPRVNIHLAACYIVESENNILKTKQFIKANASHCDKFCHVYIYTNGHSIHECDKKYTYETILRASLHNIVKFFQASVSNSFWRHLNKI
jgi:hypothetical protein